MSETIIFSKEGTIDPIRVKSAVYGRIDFELSEEAWEEINYSFAECWNDVIGLRGQVYEHQIEIYVYNHLKENRIIFDIEKVVQIVAIMTDYIRMTRGYLDE